MEMVMPRAGEVYIEDGDWTFKVIEIKPRYIVSEARSSLSPNPRTVNIYFDNWFKYINDGRLKRQIDADACTHAYVESGGRLRWCSKCDHTEEYDPRSWSWSQLKGVK